MSNNKEYSNTSRYQILRVLTDGVNKFLETYNPVKVPEVEGEDLYHVVDQSEINRLDLVALRYYKDSSFWWAIALANDFIDPFVVNEGELLRIPSLVTISDYRNEILTRKGSPAEG